MKGRRTSLDLASESNLSPASKSAKSFALMEPMLSGTNFTCLCGGARIALFR